MKSQPTADVEKKLNSSSKKHILVIGDVMIDEHINGIVERISPEAPVPVMLQNSTSQALGGAGNVALNIKTLGCDVTLASVVGNDKYTLTIQKLCKKNNITFICEKDREKTTVKSRIFSGKQHLLRIDNEQTQTISDETADKLISQLKQKKYNLILFSDYAKGLLHPKLINFITQSECISVADPKPKNITELGKLHYILPNYSELISIGKQLDIPTSMEEQTKDEKTLNLLTHISKKITATTICTRSEDGISYLQENKLITIPTKVQEVFDVTGAGDSSIAAFSVALCCGCDLHTATVLANAAGYRAVRHIGPVAIEKRDLIDTYTTMIIDNVE